MERESKLSSPARIVLAAAVAFAAAQTFFLNGQLHLTRLSLHDATTYLLLGRNLAEGNGYSVSPGLVYPTARLWIPGYPAFLSLWIRAFGTNLLVLNAVMIALATGTIAAVYRFAKTLAPPRTAALLAVLVAMHPLYFSFAHQTMADVPGILLGTLSLALLPKLGDRSKGAACGIGAFMGLAALVKGHNTALAAALLFCAWRDRRRPDARLRAWIALVGFLVPWGAWNLRNAFVQGEGYSGFTILELTLRSDRDHSVPITPYEFWRRIRTVFLYNLPFSFAACTLPWPGMELGAGFKESEWNYVVAGLLSLVLLLGFARRVWKGPSFAEIFWVGALLLVLPTTSQAGGLRHMTPILPLNLWYAIQGFDLLLGGRKKLIAPGVVLLAVSSLVATVRGSRAEIACPQGTPDLRDLASFARLERPERREYVFGPRAEFLAVVRDAHAWHRLEEWSERWKARPDLEPLLIVPVSWLEGGEWGQLDHKDVAPAPGPCPEEFRSPPWRLVKRVGRFGLYRREPPSTRRP
jgi:hypothetical protein